MRDDPYTLLKEAAVLLKKKNHETAALLYQELGDYFSKKGFYEKAVASYQKSLDLSYNPNLSLLIADIYETLHQTFAALEALNQALASLQKKEATHPLIPVIQQKIEKLTTPLSFHEILRPGASAFAEASADKQDDTERWQNMLKDAKLLLEENLFSDARKIYEKILSENPSLTEAKLALADLPEKETAFFGRREESTVKELVQSLEEKLGLSEEAASEKLIQTYTPIQSLSAETLYDLAVGYAEMGLHDKAIEHLNQALTQASQKSENKMNCAALLGSCYLAKKRAFDAISFLEKTLKENEQLLQTLPTGYQLALLYVLSEAFEHHGDLKSALSTFRTIERRDRKYRDIEERIRKIRSKIIP